MKQKPFFSSDADAVKGDTVIFSYNQSGNLAIEKKPSTILVTMVYVDEEGSEEYYNCEAGENMTLYDWIDSDYNTEPELFDHEDNWDCDEDTILEDGETYTYQLEPPTPTISVTMVYETSKGAYGSFECDAEEEISCIYG